MGGDRRVKGDACCQRPVDVLQAMDVEPDIQGKRSDLPLATKAGHRKPPVQILVRQFPVIDHDEEIDAASLGFAREAVGKPVRNQLENTTSLAMRRLLPTHGFVEFLESERPHIGQLLIDQPRKWPLVHHRRLGEAASGMSSIGLASIIGSLGSLSLDGCAALEPTDLASVRRASASSAAHRR